MFRDSSLKTTQETRDERILKLFKLPSQLEISKLYKYRSMASEKEINWLEQVFKDREIYLPPATKLNDPFECRPYLTWYRKGKKLRDYITLLVLENFPKANRETRKRLVEEGYERFRNNQDQFMENQYEDFLNTTGLYCLSKIHDNILMWSHYSYGHSGIVLEFDVAKKSQLFYEAIEVHYRKEYPITNLMEIGEPEDYINALLTKSIDWEYEKEWRIVKTPKEGGHGRYKFSHDLLTGVIFGAKIEQGNKNLILEWLKDYPSSITLYEAKINKTKYKLDIEPI